MISLQQQIVDRFLAELAASPDMDVARLAQLKALFTEKKKPTPDDFVAIFSPPHGDPIK